MLTILRLVSITAIAFENIIVSLADVQVRLTGSSYSNQGRVEVLYGGAWGTVCDDAWTREDAVVVCRQLGLPHQGAAPISQAGFGQGPDPILLDNVACTGTETNIDQCHSNGWRNHNCNHGEDAGVICQAENVKTQIRLVEGHTSNEGRVEVMYNNQWGTVCQSGFDSHGATVVCGMLGFSRNGAVIRTNAAYGQGTNQIWLGDLVCYGNESDIALCGHRGWGNTNCQHLQDAGVVCPYRQCSLNNGMCAHNCVAEVGGGGGRCTCNVGFRLDSNLYTCRDIFECVEGASSCEHNCTNTNGSYVCSCMPGFSLEADQHRCNVDPCTFDNHTECIWKEESTGDDFDWTLGNGETPSPGTGPPGDHTMRNINGKYLYIETSGSRQTGDRAWLVSPLLLPVSHNERCLQLWYNMNGPSIGYLRVYMVHDDVTPGTLLWAMTGDQGPEWKAAYIPLVSQQQYKIIIEAVAGYSYFGDIAIDDIEIFPTRCENMKSVIVG